MTVAFPYKTASRDSVNVGDWILLGENDQSTSITGSISGWDYDTPLNILRNVEILPLRILAETGLAELDARLNLNVVSLTGPSSYRQLVWSKDIPRIDEWNYEISLSLDSQDIAEALTLRTEIVLAAPIDHTVPFVASAAGSRLYQHLDKIQLEGSLGRFPMELVDFGSSIPGLRASNSMWYLDWDPSRPEARFLGGVLLYINASHEDMVRRIRDTEPLITSVLRCDVIRSMCEGMLQNEDFVTGSDHFDLDTVGGQVREWLIEAFDETGTDVLRTMLQSSPGRFEARIQEAFG